MSLYQLAGAYETLYEQIDAVDPLEENGEALLQGIMDTLEGIEGELNEKAENVALFVKSLEYDAAAIRALAPQTGAEAFHLSAKRVEDSGMIFRREGVPMGLPGISEFSVWRCDEQAVRAARCALDEVCGTPERGAEG